MRKTGSREFKTHLAEYLRRAEHGETTEIMRKGKVVARLVPAEETEAEDAYRAAVLRGEIVPPKAGDRATELIASTLERIRGKPPLLTKLDVQEAIDWQRGE